MEKMKGIEHGRKQAQMSRSPLPVDSYRIDLISLATNYDGMHEMLSFRESRLSLEVHGFYWELAMSSPSAYNVYQNSRLLERKQVFSINTRANV